MTRQPTRHCNAAEVLPRPLLERIQDAVDGQAVSLWIPSRHADASRERAERVFTLRLQGFSAPTIAAEVGLGERRVYQILAQRQPAKR